MELWRISNFADLTGEGGRLARGRWHMRGTPVVYCADHPALSLVEVLVHVDYETVPDSYQLIRIEVPDALTALRVDALPADLDACRAIGQRWLEARETPLLAVPSVIVPAAWNFLINPAHPDAHRARISDASRWPFDPRLVRQPRPGGAP